MKLLITMIAGAVLSILGCSSSTHHQNTAFAPPFPPGPPPKPAPTTQPDQPPPPPPEPEPNPK